MIKVMILKVRLIKQESPISKINRKRMKVKREPIIIMNFSGAYEYEPFANNPDFIHLNCSHLNGADCYCNQETSKKIKSIIAPYSAEGIHFIDNGNYHYITKFWIEKLNQPFSLVLFDHHTDMQPSRIPGLLSCGDWVKDAIDENSKLRKVIIIGTPQGTEEKIPNTYRKRVYLFSREKIREIITEQGQLVIKGPVYISIDKDVLSTAFVNTNWDQGTLTLQELQQSLFSIMTQNHVIGIDICGEYKIVQNLFQDQKSAYINNIANKFILQTVVHAARLKKQNRITHKAIPN
jgi:arginase family enzyme